MRAPASPSVALTPAEGNVPAARRGSRRDAGLRGQRIAGISLVLVVVIGDQASGWGRPASAAQVRTGAAAVRPLGSRRVAACGRALRLTISASRTNSPTRTPPRT